MSDTLLEIERESDGALRPLPVASWAAGATDIELRLLSHVRGPVLDVGCGPGRIVHALTAAGIATLGIDAAPAAAQIASAAGSSVLCRSVFDRVPGERRWQTVLLLDGNIGIGGDPRLLLRRVRDLLAQGGEAVVEVEPPGHGTVRDRARLRRGATVETPWFPWAWVGAEDIGTLAAGLFETCTFASSGRRHFATLRRSGARLGATVIVLAKEPLPGRVKTRLCPPCTPAAAADIALAALQDTLHVVSESTNGRKVLALDGRPGAWLPPGFEVVAQRGGGLAQRLAAAFDDTGGPAVLVGMDTPQLTPELLRTATATLAAPGVGAVIGPATDGGYWGIGLREPDAAVFEDVPMSTSQTGRVQVERLCARGLHVQTLPVLDDVDTFDEASAVARIVPDSRFARAVRCHRR